MTQDNINAGENRISDNIKDQYENLAELSDLLRNDGLRYDRLLDLEDEAG